MALLLPRADQSAHDGAPGGYEDLKSEQQSAGLTMYGMFVVVVALAVTVRERRDRTHLFIETSVV